MSQPESNSHPTGIVDQLRAYLQHKPECSLRKPKVFRKGFHLEEIDGQIETVDDTVQIDGPGESCTCGLDTLLRALPQEPEK